MSDLFTEALKDSKKLREIAEQDAKNAIVEAITPYIKEMIAKEKEGIDYSKLEKTLKDAVKKLNSYKHLHILFIRSSCEPNYYFDDVCVGGI
jgi:hypothetical protein